MAGPYTYRFSRATDVPIGGGRTQRYQPGDVFETESACDMLDFMVRVRQADPDCPVAEEKEGTLRSLVREAERAGCLSDAGTSPRPGAGTEANPQPPIDGDTPASQGAPTTPTPPGGVGRNRQSYGGPGETETPAEVLNHANPVPPESVREGLEAGGLPPADAAEAVERGRRGEPPEGERRSSHNGERTRGEAQAGEPVDLFSGRLHLHSVDLEIPTSFLALQFVRRYLSGKPYFGPLGFNWDHNWNVYLRELSSGDVARWSGELHEDVFRLEGGEFASPPGMLEKLVRQPGPGLRYVIEVRGGSTLVFERPGGWTAAERIPLVEIRDRANNRIVLSYDTEDRLRACATVTGASSS